MIDIEIQLAGLRARIKALSPQAAQAAQAQGAVLLDVRPDSERADGSPPGAVGVARDLLEWRVPRAAPDPAQPVICLCAIGARSLLAAEALERLGYTQVAHVEGGLAAWRAAGLPVARPAASLDAAAQQRYARHLSMPAVGVEGQQRLLAARVLLVGVGGLGSPVALYLAAAGVGTLGLLDDDLVERSNLQRQVVHADARVGLPKTTSAAVALKALNPDVAVVEHRERLTPGNAEACLAGYDLVVDGVDNFETRYAVADAAARLGIPHVYGSVAAFEGQVSVFHPGAGGPCYRCYVPAPPPPGVAPSCAENGVLGVLPGVVGLLQAVEAVKCLLGLGAPLIGTLLHYDALAAQTRRFGLAPTPGCPTCALAGRA